jgi:glycosyltransferase involved in cell wall biosynthesis
MDSPVLPCVSIGMPVRNCESTVGPAIQSILNQTFSDWELLIIDDGSSDQTVNLARAYSDPRIRVFADGKHEGLVARLNQAIGLSRGRYFARMDGDDISYPERLTLQVEFMARHPETDLVGGGILTFGSRGRALGIRKNRTTHGDICRRPWAGLCLGHPTWLGRMEWFRTHLYRSNAIRCEDQDLLLRTHETSRFAAVPEIVLGYREERLSLENILVGRKSFVRSVLHQARSKRQYRVMIMATIEHVAKGLVDCVAISTGLNHRLLRQRAMPMRETMLRRWKEVWEEVQVTAQCQIERSRR